MTEDPKAGAEDTSVETPGTVDEPKLAIEFAEPETVTAEPTVNDGEGAGAVEPQPQQIFGKYATIEDAEKAYQEAQRKMHEATQEASAWRQVVQQTPQPGYGHPPPPDPGQMDEAFREQWENSPYMTMQAAIQSAIQSSQQASMNQQSQTMQMVEQLGANPEYADVKDAVLQKLPYNPRADIEKLFMQEKLAKVQRDFAVKKEDLSAIEGKKTRMHVEAQGAGRVGTEKLTIQISAAEREAAKKLGLNEDDIVNAMKRKMAYSGKVDKFGRPDMERTIADFQTVGEKK